MFNCVEKAWSVSIVPIVSSFGCDWKCLLAVTLVFIQVVLFAIRINDKNSPCCLLTTQLKRSLDLVCFQELKL